MHKIVDLRSDTVTLPTPEMREAMKNAEVGDDVYGEDPTMRRLQEVSAEKIGKEDAIFVVSGTMGNQVALKTHTQPGDEIILEENAHIYHYEVAAMAAISGVQPSLIKGDRGVLVPERIEAVIRPSNYHSPRTRLVCMENTHNRAGGTVTSPQRTQEIVEVAKRHNLKVHLDGARIFNAAIYLGVDVKQLTKDADSVMFCLSKGLGAPIGSMLAGSKEFIQEAMRVRKMFGGGMRQAGVIAAPGLVALEKMVDRLAEDHENARFLAEGLTEIEGISIDMDTVQTNIIIYDISGLGIGASQFIAKLGEQQVKASMFGPELVRLVTHKDVNREDVDYALQAVRKVAKEVRCKS